MKINGTHTIYAIINLSKRNKDSAKVLEPLINAGYTIINRETESGEIIDYIVAKAEGEEI